MGGGGCRRPDAFALAALIIGRDRFREDGSIASAMGSRLGRRFPSRIEPTRRSHRRKRNLDLVESEGGSSPATGRRYFSVNAMASIASCALDPHMRRSRDSRGSCADLRGHLAMTLLRTSAPRGHRHALPVPDRATAARARYAAVLRRAPERDGRAGPPVSLESVRRFAGRAAFLLERRCAFPWEPEPGVFLAAVSLDSPGIRRLPAARRVILRRLCFRGLRCRLGIPVP